ncbi:MAG: methylmalonic aciduria and homocystinuria type D protein [Halothece sp.]|jgi:hypothetical protein
MIHPSVQLPKISPVLTLFPEAKSPLEVYICEPTPFVQDNLQNMLPDWTLPTAWVVIILQKAQFSLCDRSNIVEQEKQRLRERFMRFGVEVTFDLKEQGLLADLIDPRSGQPLFSHPGILHHDDVKVVSTLLGFQKGTGNCPCIFHPQWRDAVYPSVILSSAHPQKITEVITRVANRFHWQIDGQ